jgi:protein gp37
VSSLGRVACATPSNNLQQHPFMITGVQPMVVQFKLRTRNRGIEWCDETRGAMGGCLHDCMWLMPDGTVIICYAKSLAEHGVARAAYPHGFEHHYWRPDVLWQLPAGDEPRLIFVDSMSDLFAANVPAEHVRAVLGALRQAPHHTYQSLTKAAPQVLKYTAELPPNLWVGISSPPDWFMKKQLSRRQQELMLRRSLEVLREVKRRTGNIVWMSAEPVSWDLTTVIGKDHPLDWIVIGAASHGRRYFQPEVPHIRNLLEVMDTTRTPVFYKGNLKPLFVSHELGSEELNRWREDFPGSYRDGSPIPAVMRRQEMCLRHGWTMARGITIDPQNPARTPQPTQQEASGQLRRVPLEVL